MPDAAAAPLDCLIVGGGPAGLTAALYLARFHRRVMVVDKGEGRLQMIPRTHNLAGYPQGIRGADLLSEMRDQAARYGAALVQAEVTALRHADGLIEAEIAGAGAPLAQPVRARTVLLATGVVNHRPPLDAATHDHAVAAGLLRYCPICDGYEQSGKRIAVLGGDRHGLAEAVFLRSYSRDVTLVSLTGLALDPAERAEAERAGVALAPAPVSHFGFDEGEVRLTLADGSQQVFDTLYAALGTHTRNRLGEMLGTRLVDGECFVTDAHQRTTASGVYAAGDAVDALDQIGIAIGTGARAAVAIHNDLRARDDELLVP
ncbi:MAG TPA: NAD(P)/FAD-dependent oxidoreductase [Paracoccus solventivorans]|uniref:NAD(P)/FAD-dependent oxidoreductase n=1 Tax=Paracoccus solventivorans TaxID=53463 RepID=UPI002C8F7B3E|nr:NAD(P)/FAD-dependent oxidoreductase [Paracoccus solventivorans]HMM08456.1 NAD(P)/FAD-dependent oxidoreductase [Paracoccus solventivorans]